MLRLYHFHLLAQACARMQFGHVNIACFIYPTKTAIQISTCLIQIKARWRSPPKMCSQYSHQA